MTLTVYEARICGVWRFVNAQYAARLFLFGEPVRLVSAVVEVKQ